MFIFAWIRFQLILVLWEWIPVSALASCIALPPPSVESCTGMTGTGLGGDDVIFCRGGVNHLRVCALNDAVRFLATVEMIGLPFLIRAFRRRMGLIFVQ